MCLLEVVLIHIFGAGIASPMLVDVLIAILIRDFLFALFLLLLPAARTLQLVDILQVLLGEPLYVRVFSCSVVARVGLRIVALASAGGVLAFPDPALLLGLALHQPRLPRLRARPALVLVPAVLVPLALVGAGTLVRARAVRHELVGPAGSFPPVVVLPLVAVKHVQVLDDVLLRGLLRGGSRGLVAQSPAGLAGGRSDVVVVVPAVVDLLGVEAGELVGVVPGEVVAFAGELGPAHAEGGGVVAGAGGVEQPHVVVDPAVESAEGVPVGGKLAPAPLDWIINLILKHQMLYNPQPPHYNKHPNHHSLHNITPRSRSGRRSLPSSQMRTSSGACREAVR